MQKKPRYPSEKNAIYRQNKVILNECKRKRNIKKKHKKAKREETTTNKQTNSVEPNAPLWWYCWMNVNVFSSSPFRVIIHILKSYSNIQRISPVNIFLETNSQAISSVIISCTCGFCRAANVTDNIFILNFIPNAHHSVLGYL